MPPDEDRNQDHEDDGVLRLDEDGSDRKRGGRLAPALDEEDEGGEHEQRPDCVHLTPQRRVIPAHGQREVERRGHDTGPAAEPSPTGPREQEGDREIGEDRRGLEERCRGGLGGCADDRPDHRADSADEPQDIQVAGRVVGRRGVRVESAGPDRTDRLGP